MAQLEQSPADILTPAHRYGPNESADSHAFKPGDFILTHEKGWHNRLIIWGQALRFRGKNRKYNRWSHAAMIVSADGGLIEAVGSGVRKGHLRDYEGVEYHLVNIDAYADDRDRARIIKFVEACLRHEYSYSTICGIALNLVFGTKIHFGYHRAIICSALVARALERSNVIFEKSPYQIMPADLAYFFKVTPPEKSIPKRTGRVFALRAKKGIAIRAQAAAGGT
jgi:hypothetical protein